MEGNMEHEIRMIDIVAPDNGVEITIDRTVGHPETLSIWINVDGITRLRVTRIPYREFSINCDKDTVEKFCLQ
jgi:hypothetical protein